MRNDRRNDRRRDTGGRRSEGGYGLKKALYVALLILILGLITFFVTMKIYNKNLEKVYSDLKTSDIGQTTEQDMLLGQTEETSTNLGNSMQDYGDNTPVVSIENEEAKVTSTNQEKVAPKKEEKKEQVKENTPKETAKPQEPVKDPEFILPVEGELMKEYAKDKLVYSETLKEWVVHTGIDIKADKTTVVKSAEAGKVTAIKNDPRYGITVIIEHANGYETRYANLLTSEFVTVGEEVTKGQTIGTVGNTATFEVLDDYHLHFEILKNGEYQDPIFFVQI